MVSTCIDPVLHDLEFLRSNSRYLYEVGILQKNFRLLRTFLLSVKEWGNNDVYLGCTDKRNLSLQSFVSSIEDTVKKYAVDIHSLCLGKESELVHLQDMVSNFIESIGPLKLEITKAYTCLLECSSLQHGPFMRDDELMELVDSVLQILVDLRGRLNINIHHIYPRARGELEAFEVKLTFLKNLVSFSILRGVELGQLEDLLTCIHVVSLIAARFCYTCDAIEKEYKICSLIFEQIPNIEPVDHRLFETCIKILRASRLSTNLQSIARDKHIMRDFNDSLLSILWEIIRCSFISMYSVKDQVEILYVGLKFLRNILREPHEKMDELNEKIGARISEAGIIICSLTANQAKGGDGLDCYAMLFGTNRGINLIKDQIRESSWMGGLPSYHSFKGQAVPKSSSLVLSKRKTAVIDEVVVGFDDEVETVVDRLIGGSRRLEVVPIVGMAGRGKTTLAKKVNENPLVVSHFHIRLWCCVSQLYDQKNLILQLLCDDDKYSEINEDDLPQRLKDDLCDDNKYSGMNEVDLPHRLYQKLKGKRYLIVFDDVWDIRFWNDLRLSFPNDENGSRILFTSRFSDMASQVEFGKEPHNLRSLTECESWELLKKKVFGDGDCPQELRILGKEIAKNCKGLPLSIVIIAGVLATIELDGWEEVAKRLTLTILYDTDLCKNMLQMSYEHLPQYLKPCFLYFGAFREDQEIEAEKLMWLWIAEGFVQNTEPKRPEDVAEDYMKYLICRNLVMVSREKSMGGVKACRIHDLLHEFCKSKAREENFLPMLQGHDELSDFIEPPKLQRLSICSMLEHFKKSRILCPNLSSLLLFSPAVRCEDLQMADILFICCFYKHLRVLNLVAFRINCKDFPFEINALVQLRYLAIQGTIRVIPPSIANLSNLETFLVQSDITGSVSLPETIWNMKKLRHLHFGWHDGYCLPECSLDNASSLHNLDTFSRLIISSGKNLEEIVKKIPNVRKLKIRLSQAKQSTIACSCTLSLISLNQLESLESLTVSCDIRFSADVEFCFPSTLKKLTLEYLHLPWSKISLVEELPNLEVLKLLHESFEGKSWNLKGGGFPKLRVLHLESLNLKEWTNTDCDDIYFPCLEKFQLVGMWNLKKVPSCLETIPTLKTIEVKIRLRSECTASLVRGIKEEQQDNGNENLEIIIDDVRLRRKSVSALIRKKRAALGGSR